MPESASCADNAMEKEKSRVGMTVFGGITLVSAFFGNLAHSLFTLWVVIEQMKTGWGYGTDMEMAVLAPWFVELLCIPVLTAGAVFFLVNIKQRAPKGIVTANAVLYGMLALQIGVFNLFIHF